MLFLLLISVLLFTVGAASQVSAAPKKNLSPLAKQVKELWDAEKPTTANEDARVLCLMTACRFEDKDGCKSNCAQWAAILDPAKMQENTKDPTTEEECLESCTISCSVPAKAKEVCTPMCKNLYPPGWEKYAKELNEAMAEALD